MIEPEQKELAEYVKQVHLSLRRQARKIGAEKAWAEHLKNEEILQKYAICMKNLAQNYWSVNNKSDSENLLCRIQWIMTYVIEYFHNGLIKKEYEKELNKMKMFQSKNLVSEDEIQLYGDCDFKFDSKLKLLDVGSCYNPFQGFDFVEIYPIDLFPATNSVKKCNFIDVEIKQCPENWFIDNVKEIPCDFFDVVVFSLFLEYLPSPEQRFICVSNAYECLKNHGLLLIVTPDSKHASANAGLMKKWKLAAANLGFVRTKLEKLKYLYCMCFRKCVSKKYPSLLYNISSDMKETFVIPQDSVQYEIEEETYDKSEDDEDTSKSLFSELPCL